MIQAKEFHTKTKHSPESIRKSNWRMNFENKPFPFKVYKDEQPIALENDFALLKYNGIIALTNQKLTEENNYIDKRILTTLLFFTGGISRILHRHFMRTASATGALYPIELYFTTQNMPDLEDGLYHFSVGDFSLSQLRKGNFHPFIAQNSSDPAFVLQSSLVIIMASYGWKNIWKYQERSYRHWFWDGGVMISNLLASTIALSLNAKVLTAFLDEKLNNFVGLQPQQEAVIALIPIQGIMEHSVSLEQKYDQLLPITLRYSRLSPKEYDFPLIWEIHKNTSFSSLSEVQKWNQNVKDYNSSKTIPTQKKENWIGLLDKTLSIEETILQRGSTERFTAEPLAQELLMTMLKASNSGIPLDIFLHSNTTNIDCYLNVHQVEGLVPGAYYYNQTEQTLELLKKGYLSQKTAFLCLEQDVFGSCQAVIFLVANINNMIEHFGERAYRVAQLEAGIILGKLYLSAFAVQIGARGTTFFDDEVIKHFSPHATGKDVMTAVGIGIPAYKAKIGAKMGQLFTRKQLVNELSKYVGDDKKNR